MLKVNSRNTRARCEICSKLTIKIPERSQCRRFTIIVVNFNKFQISSSVLIINFEQAKAY